MGLYLPRGHCPSGPEITSSSPPIQTASRFRRAPTPQVLGPFDGKLSNSGETIRLVNNGGRLLNRVEYGTDGDWPLAPDGSGVRSGSHSRPMRGTDDTANWSWSDQVGGTPGAVNFTDGPQDRSLRFNEIGDPGDGSFQVELTYTGSDPISLGNFALEIDGDTPAFYILPAVSLEPGRLYVFSDADFGVVPSPGDRLCLWHGTTSVSDATVVTDSARGRYPDGADTWYALESTTFGVANQIDSLHGCRHQ